MSIFSSTHLNNGSKLNEETSDTSQTTYRVLEFEVIPGLGGDYAFYAVYVEEGKNPMTDSFLVLRSNVATANVVLSNR